MTLREISQAAGADGVAVQAEVGCQVVKTHENMTKGGKPYLDVEITDGTATEKFKIWEDSNAYAFFHDIQAGEGVLLEATFFRNQYGLNLDRVRGRLLEKQELVELFAGTAERREALERDWVDVTALVVEIKDPRIRLLC